VPLKTGPIIQGHPHVSIQVSSDGKTGKVFLAMIDTGFSGFVSVPSAAARVLGLDARATARYTMADGRSSEPFPLAEGFACIEGEHYVNGLISVSENATTVIGMNFLRRTGKALILGSGGVVIMSESDLMAALRAATSD